MTFVEGKDKEDYLTSGMILPPKPEVQGLEVQQ